MKKTLLFVLLFLPILIFSQTPKEIFKKAKSHTMENDFIPLYKNLCKNYPNDYYAQLSLLELSKIELLKRNYQKALDYLKKIDNPKIKEKPYWLAKVYLKLGKYIPAIYSAQNFIYLAPYQKDKAEDMLITIAEAFIQKKSYYKALSTLNSLRKSEYANNFIPLIVYKTGECYEKLEKYEKAIKIYKKMKIDFPYNQYTYFAQDRIYELTSEYDIKLNDTPKKPKKLDKAAVSPNDFDLYLQAGAYGTKAKALLQQKRINSLGIKTTIGKKTKHNKALYIVYAGPFKNTDEMKKASNKLKEKNIEFFIYKKYKE
jgi:tetratricopeptide (TPR) repeat protein